MNKVILLGRVTKTPELQKTKNGESLLRFNLAVDNHGHEADFINCVAFKTNADNIAKYVGKGQQLCIEGRLQINQYTDQDGTRKSSYSVVVDRFYFTADKRKDEPTNQHKNAPVQPQDTSVDDDIKNFFDKYEEYPF